MSVMSRLSLVLLGCASITLLSAANGPTRAQTLGEPEDFTALAVVNNNLASGAGTVLIHVSRWSTEKDRASLIEALQEKGPDQLLDELKDMQSVGTIRSPDSLAYDLRYAHQQAGPDGGRQIVLATDRPIAFWEASHQWRTIDYPFTVLQMQIAADGKGKGTLSIATKVVAHDDVVQLENFSNQPVMLTEITSKKAKP